jgi:phytoene dehydrogenase-like protein
LQNSKKVYDIVFVGAGHNGLVCASYLAKAGLKVLLLEQNDLVGGACITEELIPGYKCSSAGIVNALLRKEIIQELNLHSHGLEFISRDPSSITLFPDGQHLLLGPDVQKCQEQIQKFSRKDAEAYPRYGAKTRELAQFLIPYLMHATPDINQENAEIIKDELAHCLNLPARDLVALLEWITCSAQHVLSSWFESDAIKVPLVIDGITGFNASPSMPGTAFLMLHHMTSNTEAGRPAWGQIRGGMGGITQALERCALAYGATIRTRAQVVQIQIVDSQVTGIVLASGEEIPAKVIVSAADPYATFIHLIEPRHLPAPFRRAIQNMDFEGVATKIHVALDELPRFKGFDRQSSHLQHRGTVLIAPSMEYLEDAYADAHQGRPSRYPHIECTFPSVLDPSLAPEGKHLMGILYSIYSLHPKRCFL